MLIVYINRNIAETLNVSCWNGISLEKFYFHFVATTGSSWEQYLLHVDMCFPLGPTKTVFACLYSFPKNCHHCWKANVEQINILCAGMSKQRRRNSNFISKQWFQIILGVCHGSWVLSSSIEQFPGWGNLEYMFSFEQFTRSGPP